MNPSIRCHSYRCLLLLNVWRLPCWNTGELLCNLSDFLNNTRAFNTPYTKTM